MLGGAWQRATTGANVPAGAAGGTIERLRDGPALDLAAAGDTSRTRWDVQVRIRTRDSAMAGTQSHGPAGRVRLAGRASRPAAALSPPSPSS